MFDSKVVKKAGLHQSRLLQVSFVVTGLIGVMAHTCLSALCVPVRPRPYVNHSQPNLDAAHHCRVMIRCRALRCAIALAGHCTEGMC